MLIVGRNNISFKGQLDEALSEIGGTIKLISLTFLLNPQETYTLTKSQRTPMNATGRVFVL